MMILCPVAHSNDHSYNPFALVSSALLLQNFYPSFMTSLLNDAVLKCKPVSQVPFCEGKKMNSVKRVGVKTDYRRQMFRQDSGVGDSPGTRLTINDSPSEDDVEA